MPPTAIAIPAPESVPKARRQSRQSTSVPRYAVILWAITLITVGFGVWAIGRGDGPPPAYYVVKWEPSGKCSVVTEQPENGRGKLLWFSLLYESAARKSKEFRKNLRCT